MSVNLDMMRMQLLMERIERPYMIKLAKEKNRYIRQASMNFESMNSLSIMDFRLHQKNILDIMSAYNKKTISVFVNDLNKATKSKIDILETKIDDTEQLDLFVDNLWLYWLETETARNAIEVSGTTKKDIERAISQSIADGEFNTQVAKRILRARGLSVWRAEAIARTETHNTAMYANKETAKELQREGGVELLKKWLPSSDERTRESHRAMADHPAISMDAKFNVGGEMMDRPGDPNASAKNVIHCRCILTYEPV